MRSRAACAIGRQSPRTSHWTCPRPRGRIHWERCSSLATCNVLFRARLVEPPQSLRFDETMQFTGGSDREFFMRAHKLGAKLLRVNGIDVLEEVHEDRGSRLPGRAHVCSRQQLLLAHEQERARPGGRRADRHAGHGPGRQRAGEAGRGSGAAAGTAPARRAVAMAQRLPNLCFAAGCLTPLAGVRAYPYRTIQGA